MGLDTKGNHLTIMHLTGCHVDRQGNKVTDMNAPFEILEEVTGINMVLGASISPQLAAFS
jgi:hypothetical protein